jgi:YbbR domain-containing protein
MDIKKIKRKIKRNWKLKIIALILALLFWLHVIVIARGALF